MRRPWYTYLLMVLGVLTLLGAVFRPASTAPGATVSGPHSVLRVLPGTPLALAGARTGDHYLTADTVVPQGGASAPVRVLRWRGDLPRAGSVTLLRNGQPLTLAVRPVR